MPKPACFTRNRIDPFPTGHDEPETGVASE
jgi:hypothetical protein